MKKIKLGIIGGFLGSGKTTLILSLAKQLIENGYRIGIVTNDQGSDLVDTEFLLANGLSVMAVEGGCFCCNFEEFTSKINTMVKDELPDVILAEPVGSCTDLIATIFRPFQIKYSNEFDIAPLTVVADPKRTRRLLMQEEESLFPTEINYLFQKQLEEADIILLNKCDLYAPEETRKIKQYLKKYAGVVVLEGSALNGMNISRLLPIILGETMKQKPLMELDYEAYGLAEEFLGWMNAHMRIENPNGSDMLEMIKYFMNGAKNDIIEQNGEIAHFKTYAISSGGYMKLSLTANDDEIGITQDNAYNALNNSFVINARVRLAPELLEKIVRERLHESCKKFGMTYADYRADSFKPGRPCVCARTKEYS